MASGHSEPHHTKRCGYGPRICARLRSLVRDDGSVLRITNYRATTLNVSGVPLQIVRIRLDADPRCVIEVDHAAALNAGLVRIKTGLVDELGAVQRYRPGDAEHAGELAGGHLG